MMLGLLGWTTRGSLDPQVEEGDCELIPLPHLPLWHEGERQRPAGERNKRDKSGVGEVAWGKVCAVQE